ncbi:MAG: VanZ family protein [Armatimonadetes bacterium]|nr:VanZ family protein [Armatimonadota bacterium]
MREVAKYASPILVVLGLAIFRTNDSPYLLPVVCEILGLGALFLVCPELRRRPNGESLLLFWLGPLGLFWLISERRDGRDISPISLMIEIALAGIGTSVLLANKRLKKEDLWLVTAILLNWSVAYFSASTGGADKMHPWFTFLGLTSEQIIRLVIWIRKIIHVTFYGTLMALFGTYLSRVVDDRRRAMLTAFAFPLCISICDEFRQSFMPNRVGSYADVILDMSAATVVLLWMGFKNHKNSVVTSE